MTLFGFLDIIISRLERAIKQCKLLKTGFRVPGPAFPSVRDAYFHYGNVTQRYVLGSVNVGRNLWMTIDKYLVKAGYT